MTGSEATSAAVHRIDLLEIRKDLRRVLELRAPDLYERGQVRMDPVARLDRSKANALGKARRLSVDK